MRRRRSSPRPLWRIPWKREHPQSRLLPGDIVRRLNGELLTVVVARGALDVDRPALVPLGVVLARSLLVIDASSRTGLVLGDALIAAGWTPPQLPAPLLEAIREAERPTEADG